jgi:ABC-type uncharacterized transport system involved in gliding motility auxiliary subunit
MSTKKKPTKKPAAKKAATKKPAPKAKVATNKKSANAKKPQAKSSAKRTTSAANNQQVLKALAMMPTLKASSAQASSLATRRPTPNPPLSEENLIIINNAFARIRALL